MTREQIEQIDALAEKATDGTLAISSLCPGYVVKQGTADVVAAFMEFTEDGLPHLTFDNAEANQKLYIALVNAWPKLRDLALRGLEVVPSDLSKRLRGYANSTRTGNNTDELTALLEEAADALDGPGVVVPREIDRDKHRHVLDVWNNGLIECETLEMMWPKLVDAIAAAPKENPND